MSRITSADYDVMISGMFLSTAKPYMYLHYKPPETNTLNKSCSPDSEPHTKKTTK